MKKAFRKILLVFGAAIIACTVFSLICMNTVTSFGDPDLAADITTKAEFTFDGFSNTDRVTDGAAKDGAECGDGGGSVKIGCDESIGGLYIKFNSINGEYSVKGGGTDKTAGQNGFLHEYIDIAGDMGEVAQVELDFDGKVNISEIIVLSAGQLPDWVQIWQPTLSESDMLLFSAHSDDDQLFFAGLIPYYTSLDYKIQVAYLTLHPDEVRRRHELLDGLWVAGDKYYPILGEFDDFRIDDLEDTVDEYADRGTSYDELEGFVVETIRRTKPLVTVSHDPKGEYGHGMHILLSKLVTDSIVISADGEKYPESADDYGVWTVEKTYLHLYDKNKIVLGIDTPLETLGGKSAFEVSQEAFMMHTSQHWTWFKKWIYGENNNITKASQITTYNPAYYGLYDSKVGADNLKNDMFENVLSYEQRAERDSNLAYIEELKARLDELTKQLDEYKDTAVKNEQLTAALEGAQKQVDSLTQSIEKLTKSDTDNRDTIAQQSDEINRLKLQCNELIEKLSAYENVTIAPETFDSDKDMYIDEARRADQELRSMEKKLTLCIAVLLVVMVISGSAIAYFAGRCKHFERRMR